MQPMNRPAASSRPIPVPPTPFIGRAKELAEIGELLTSPASRMVTLLGPGGIGKTRLSIQAATEVQDHFADGVYFVRLRPVETTDRFISAIGEALQLSLTGQEEPATQLLNYLRNKDLLLVLDNFEQLLRGEEPADEALTAVDFLIELLQTAPGLKLLVTSRQVLNMQEEWLYAVQGLSFPLSASASSSPDVEAYSAVQLFVERAKRVRRDFSPAGELAHIVRICQLVGGMPLAIELAAAWTKSLPAADIAAEIQQNVDFLTTNKRDIPGHQRSMRAVFDQSWKLLTEPEQNVFKRLSVFRGTFSYEAAKQVAGASLVTLSILVDKSLLRSEADGRYQVHELLRQYAAEQLVQTPEAVARVYDRHSAYYTDFLRARTPDLEGGRQREAIEAITAELDNIRAAWQWAVQQGHLEQIQKAAYPLFNFYDFQGRYQEGAELFEQAVRSLDSPTPAGQPEETLAQLLVVGGWHYVRVGQLDRARAALERARTIYEDLQAAPSPGFATDPLIGLGVLANIAGDYETARQLGEEARRLSGGRADQQNLQVAYYVLTNAAFAQGRYHKARYYAQQAFLLSERTDNRWFRAYILGDLGNIARALGDLAQARQHYQASYAIRQAFNDPEGMAIALNHLGTIAEREGDLQEAERLYGQAQTLYEEIGDRGGLAVSLNGLGSTATALGHYQAASRHFHRALQITTEIRYVPLTLSILAGVGELLGQTGQPERAIELLAFVKHHPAGDRETKDRVEPHLSGHKETLAPEEVSALIERGADGEFERLVAEVQLELAALSEAPAEEGGAASSPAQSALLPEAASVLVEPLTSREFEVLGLIASGMTNKQMAEALVISVGTAKWYTSQIYGKLNVSSRTQAVAKARELALLV